MKIDIEKKIQQAETSLQRKLNWIAQDEGEPKTDLASPQDWQMGKMALFPCVLTTSR
jgi:hypothetical protein